VRPRRAVTLELHHDVVGWLDWEAELLDGGRLREWLALLAEDVSYRMPVTVTARRESERAVGDMDHWDEDLYSLTKRVERLESEHAWTEDPASRTRRFVTNVRVTPGQQAGHIAVRSYVLLFRSRGDERSADLVSAERRDVLLAGDEDWRLVRRLIRVDESVLRTQNLAVFL
jgi:3-phenylpropionate/cinnamic acid dioxygenase small subunit